MRSSTFRPYRPPTYPEEEGGELSRSSTRMMPVSALKPRSRQHVMHILERRPVSALPDIGPASLMTETTCLELVAMAVAITAGNAIRTRL
jgi:hypothetical protein